MMMYCPHCGAQIPAGADVCGACGKLVASNQGNSQAQVDNGGFLWGLLGCCVPIVGLILFLVWKQERPKTAKAAGIGALVSVIVWVVFWIAYVFLFAALIASGIPM